MEHADPFLSLSKLLPPLVYPLGLMLFLGAVAALLCLAGRRGASVIAGLVGLLILGISATPAFSYWLIGHLEDQYPPRPAEQLPEAQAIVMLGGGASAEPRTELGIDLHEAADRIIHSAQLFWAGKAPTLVLSGGGHALLGTTGPEATPIANLLVEIGIPRDVIQLETESLNTRQNAVEVRRLLPSRVNRVLLVTSASHMPRAKAVFDRLGFEVEPAATDYQALGRISSPIDWIPSAEGLLLSTKAFKEYLGTFVYGIKGWT